MQTRHVFVRVVDQLGAPIADLRTSNFTLTEDGAPRVVVAASRERSDARRAGAGSATRHRRHSRTCERPQAAFLDALPPDDEVLLATTGRQLRIQVQPTTITEKLKNGWRAVQRSSAC